MWIPTAHSRGVRRGRQSQDGPWRGKPDLPLRSTPCTACTAPPHQKHAAPFGGCYRNPPPIHSTLPVKKKKAALSGCKTTTSNSLKVKYVEMLIDVGKPRACSCLPILSFRWRCKKYYFKCTVFFFKWLWSGSYLQLHRPKSRYSNGCPDLLAVCYWQDRKNTKYGLLSGKKKHNYIWSLEINKKTILLTTKSG